MIVGNKLLDNKRTGRITSSASLRGIRLTPSSRSCVFKAFCTSGGGLKVRVRDEDCPWNAFSLPYRTVCECTVCVQAQSRPTLCDPMDCTLPGSSVHGIFQARILEWIAISFSKRSSQLRDQTCVSCVSCFGGFFTTEPPGKHIQNSLCLF